MKAYSIIMVYRDNWSEVLLQKKLRGPEFNIGKWNGVGGKIEPHEEADACAIRELEEETGLKRDDLQWFNKLTVSELFGVGPYKEAPATLHVYYALIKDNVSIRQLEDEPLQWFKSCELYYIYETLAGHGNVMNWHDMIITFNRRKEGVKE